MKQNRQANPILIVIAVAVSLYFSKDQWIPLLSQAGIEIQLPSVIYKQKQANQQQQEQQQNYYRDNPSANYMNQDPHDAERIIADSQCANIPTWLETHPQHGTKEQFYKDHPYCKQ